LPITQQSFEVIGHIILNEIRGATGFANFVGLVPPRIEIPMTDLSVVFLAHGIVALASMHGDMDVVRQPLDRGIDRIDGGVDFLLIGHAEQRFINLNVHAASRGEALKIEPEQLAQIHHRFS
jgi:hypothetical protein